MYATMFRLTAIFITLLAAACASDGGSQQVAVTPGFYRYADEGGVFYIPPSNKTYCLVVSVSMMEAFGGFPQVHVVDHGVDFKGTRTWTEQCPWPAGKYRDAGSSVVWDVTPSHLVCREKPAAHPAHDPAVLTVASGSDIILKSKYTGICGKQSSHS